jgi:hypothetical protein
VPSAECAFEVVSVTPVDADYAMTDLGATFAPLKSFLAAHPAEEFLVTNRACPCGGGRVRNIIHVARRTLAKGADPSFDAAWDRYKTGDDEYRNLHMKYERASEASAKKEGASGRARAVGRERSGASGRA